MNLKYENCRIKRSSHNWELQKPKSRKDKQVSEVNIDWESFQWFSSLQSVLTEYQTRTLEVETIIDALEKVKRLFTALTSKFNIKLKEGGTTNA